MTGRRTEPRFLKTGFVRATKLSICKVSHGFGKWKWKMALWKMAACCCRGAGASQLKETAEMFVIRLNSATKAKKDKSQGQKLAGPWRTALHLRRSMF